MDLIWNQENSMNDVNQIEENLDKLGDFVHPPIYSRIAIRGFSIFFSPLFGGVLLMQNLRDVGRKKEALIVLGVSLLMTILTVLIVSYFDFKNRSLTLICNIGGATVLTEYFYMKYFPDESLYVKKKIWIPLIIGALLVIGFVLLLFYEQDQVA